MDASRPSEYLRRKVVLFLVLLVPYIKHIQRVRLRLQEVREERLDRHQYQLTQAPISYETKVFRLDSSGSDDVDFREYL